jgi:Thioredoxin-like
MLHKNAAPWGDKVRLIGLSIDNDAATVKSHVEAKKWTSVEHYHVRTPGCTADKDYGVNGVPHVLLVDTNGKIVYVGHPASRNLEEDINTLLSGKPITGDGT